MRDKTASYCNGALQQHAAAHAGPQQSVVSHMRAHHTVRRTQLRFWRDIFLQAPWQLSLADCTVCGQPVGVRCPWSPNRPCTYIGTGCRGQQSCLPRWCPGSRDVLVHVGRTMPTHQGAVALCSGCKVAAGSGSACESTIACSIAHHNVPSSRTQLQQQQH